MSEEETLRAIVADIYLRADLARGLFTPELRARYVFWRAMGNASPTCKRWGYHPGVEYSNCDPAPWCA